MQTKEVDFDDVEGGGGGALNSMLAFLGGSGSGGADPALAGQNPRPADAALLDRVRLGYELVIFSTLKIATLGEEKRGEFLRKLELVPEITEAHTIFGEMDVLIKVIAPNMAWYQTFVFNTLMKLPGVIDIRSTVTLAEIMADTGHYSIDSTTVRAHVSAAGGKGGRGIRRWGVPEED